MGKSVEHMGTYTRRAARFPSQMWSQYGPVVDNLPITNNAKEGTKSLKSMSILFNNMDVIT